MLHKQKNYNHLSPLQNICYRTMSCLHKWFANTFRQFFLQFFIKTFGILQRQMNFGFEYKFGTAARALDKKQ
jgi:hypothetical protein